MDPNEMMARRTFNNRRLTGGALSNTWAQIMADRIGVPMHRQSKPRIHNVVGMGLLAFSRLGRVNLEDIPGMIQFDRVFELDLKNQAVYDHLYAQFTAAREKTRPVFHALNKA